MRKPLAETLQAFVDGVHRRRKAEAHEAGRAERLTGYGHNQRLLKPRRGHLG